MKGQASHVVRDGGSRMYITTRELADNPAVVISNRLVSSPCAIVADVGGYTANVERLISAHISYLERDEIVANSKV
jgi:heat shock protein beta